MELSSVDRSKLQINDDTETSRYRRVVDVPTLRTSFHSTSEKLKSGSMIRPSTS